MGFFTQTLVTMMLILGGADCMQATAGIDSYLGGFLIPLGVIWYTMVGGLKATFLASYIHTSIIFVGLVIMVTFTYAVSPGTGANCPHTPMVDPMTPVAECTNFFNGMCYDGIPKEQCDWIGSASVMYERLAFLVSIDPEKLGTSDVEGAHHGACCPDPQTKESGNLGGSYLTMLSTPGIEFGVINIVGNFATVFVDQSYWQSAIAASPASSHKGYMLGGLVWFTIPFALATSLGLCALALQLPIKSSEAGAGLVPPAVATHLFGSAGATMMAIMLFMAITSTGSAEGIAVSSLVAYDIYKAYCNPAATGKQILKISKIVIV